MKLLTRVTAIVLSVATVLIASRCGGGSEQSPQPLAITTTSLPNGTAWVTYSQMIHASGGVGPYSWTVKSGALPHNLVLGSGASSSVMLSGIPDTAAQSVPFTVQVTDSAGHSASQSYSVSILLEPDTLVASPSALSFGMRVNGTSSSAQTAMLTNTGSTAVAIVGVAVTGSDVADFSSTSTCSASIAAGANCSISVTFNPTALGPRVAALVITDNTQGSPHSYSLDGVGVTQGPNVTFWTATSYTFSSAPGVPSQAQQVRVANFGTATLDVTRVSTTSQFSETDNCVCSVAPGNSCYICMVFTPSASGTVQGSLSLTDNAPGSPQSASLAGTGNPGQCIQRGGFCTKTSQCCAGLQCTFIGGNRPSNRCE